MTQSRHLLALLTLVGTLFPALAHAQQYELKSGNFNATFASPAAFPRDTSAGAIAVTTGQFASVGISSGASSTRPPDDVTSASTPGARYPGNASFSLVRSSIGGGFATDVPRYKLGEIIPPPIYKADLTLLNPATESDYWRPEPLKPGETFDSNPPLIPVGKVTVIQASTNNTVVQLKPGVQTPPELVVGALLLEEPITFIAGTTITLARKPKENIPSERVKDVVPAQPYHYSPHEGSPDRPNTPSRAVYASSSGAVTITWVSRQPEGGVFRTLQESFTVSNKTNRPVRNIFWTAGSGGAAKGPAVEISDSRIVRVDIAYNRSVPKAVAVATEQATLGDPVLTTLASTALNGTNTLSAANVQGTVLIEYIQNSSAGSGTYYSMGTELVRLVREATPGYPTVNLGKEIVHEGEPLLVPSPVTGGQGTTYYAEFTRSDGRKVYIAEKATSLAKDPDDGKPKDSDEAYNNKVSFFWKEAGDFGILWPKYLDHYWLRWSPNTADYQHYTVEPTGSTPENGLSFGGGTLPTLVSQDDPNGNAKVNATTQRFHVTLPTPTSTNRALLKFSAGAEPWYVLIYTQAGQDVRSITKTGGTVSTVSGETIITLPTLPNTVPPSTAGLEVGMVLTPGGGVVGDVVITRIISGTQIAVSALVTGSSFTFTVQADNKQPLVQNAVVGSRIEPPSGYEKGGYIVHGTTGPGRLYALAAYINPVTAGVATANQGAIIPVNALPTDNELKIRWYKKVEAPSADFSSFYIPGKIGTYKVAFPTTTTPEIIIAQGVGTDNLPADQATGTIYTQNDSAQIGYNPNEEHAIMLGGRAYALADSYNFGTGVDFTSQACVLVAFTNALDQRPDMRAFLVKAESPDYSFRYLATAGTLLNKPYPLPLLPPPVPAMTTTVPNTGDAALFVSTALDYESAGSNPPVNTALSTTDAYNKFVFADRKGFRWVHRGAHNDAKLVSAEYGLLTDPTKTIDVTDSVRALLGVSSSFITGYASFGIPDPAPATPDASQQTKLTFSVGGTTQVITKNHGDRLSISEVTGMPQFTMQLYYKMQAGFWMPTTSGTLPKVGTNLPFGRRPGQASKLFVDADGVPYHSLPISHDQPRSIIYHPVWPTDAPTMNVGETLTLPKFGLPAVRGQKSVQIHYQQSLALDSSHSATAKASVTLHDSTRQKIKALTKPLPTSILTTRNAGKVYFQKLPPHLQQRVFIDPLLGEHGSLVLIGKFYDVAAGEDYTDLNLLLGDDLKKVLDLAAGVTVAADKAAFETAVNALSTTMETFGKSPTTGLVSVINPPVPRPIAVGELSDVTHPDTAVDSYALTALGKGAGYVTLVFGNGTALTPEGDPVTVSVIKVNPELYTGDLKVLLSSNPFDEQVTLRHSGDFAGKAQLPDEYEWQWFWTTGAATAPNKPTGDSGAALGVWQKRDDTAAFKSTNVTLVGGSVDLPFGGPTFVLNDRWFTMRYRPKSASGSVVPSGTWSAFTEPMLVEGWVKRVLNAINPFEQRVKDLANTSVNTDVSVITQAGKRWEGDIPLTLDAVNDLGLIEIYETVLNRAKNMSIDANTNDPDSNNALLLAAGYLNDLYTLLGNEAFADAANPTISIDDQGSATQINTSRFAFESQVASSLDEELALLRGRDDSVSPGVKTAPAYNRLYWNFTGGINSGQAIYALNYNIKEKVGSSTANGVINEEDAQRMFPQGHGDAYGHYLTCLTSYYRLLTNANFTWAPRAEAVTVLGQPVTVDFQDERKFAASAYNLARSAQQIAALTWRQNYNDNPSAGWTHFRDSTGTNSQTGVTRAQGLDEWISRSAQGALFHWAMASAMVPDNDPYHTGVQKIDRTTVLELSQMPALADSFQVTIDNANAHLNPLGLAPGAIVFDIDPFPYNSLGQELADPGNVGKGHYEQVAQRAVKALNNAAGGFNQAASMTGMLRNLENQLDDDNTGIQEQERAFRNELIDIFGSPYAADIGPGKTYAQGYVGPDLYHWFIVERPIGLTDTTGPQTVTIQQISEDFTFTTNSMNDIVNSIDATTNTIKHPSTVPKTITVNPSSFIQFRDIWAGGQLNSSVRSQTGELQDALLDTVATQNALSSFMGNYTSQIKLLQHQARLIKAIVANQKNQSDTLAARHDKLVSLDRTIGELENTAAFFGGAADIALATAEALSEAFPKSIGLASDATSGARSIAKLVGVVIAAASKVIEFSTAARARVLQTDSLGVELSLERELTALGFSQEQVQLAYEFDQNYRAAINSEEDVMALVLDHQRALQNVRNVLARADRVQAEITLFRQRAASIIQGYRTKDVTFRLFRNEALEQYRSLFDLASRYSYLAAKSYDYETGLLGSTAGTDLMNQIVASRALGDLADGNPQLTTSVLGDGGLANVLARLDADWSVAESRFGINSPGFNNTNFSLRNELFRIGEDDEAWRQTLEQHVVANIMLDKDVSSQCLNIRKPDGSAVPGFIIPFSTSILHGRNFFGLELAGGDHNYSPSTYAVKIGGVGMAFPGYVGIDGWEDQYEVINETTGIKDTAATNAAVAAAQANILSATPYIYFVPVGTDYQRVPMGDTNTIRNWNVLDQALPLPFNLGASAFNSTQFFNANGTLSEQPWIIRKHPAFRAVWDPGAFAEGIPLQFTSARLVARSAWNSQWKIVIPAYNLLNNENEGLNRFSRSVKDVVLFLRTYSHSGN